MKRCFAYLPSRLAVQKARIYFLCHNDHFGTIPRIGAKEYHCKMFAVDCLREIARKNPELLKEDVIDALKCGCDDSNAATRLGIIEVFEITRQTGKIPFLKSVVASPRVTVKLASNGEELELQGKEHRTAARKAIISLSSN